MRKSNRTPMADRFWPKVEKTETCWIWTGANNGNGYGQFWLGDRGGSAHRASWELANGPIPEGMEIDHACLNKGCVNPDHLRLATHKQNMEHRSAVRALPRGVSWHKGDQAWRVRVNHNRKTHFVGNFDNIADAEAAAVAKRLELFTHNDLDKAA